MENVFRSTIYPIKFSMCLGDTHSSFGFAKGLQIIIEKAGKLSQPTQGQCFRQVKHSFQRAELLKAATARKVHLIRKPSSALQHSLDLQPGKFLHTLQFSPKGNFRLTNSTSHLLTKWGLFHQLYFQGDEGKKAIWKPKWLLFEIQNMPPIKGRLSAGSVKVEETKRKQTCKTTQGGAQRC